MDEILERFQSRSGLTRQHAEIMLLISEGASIVQQLAEIQASLASSRLT